MQIGGIFRGAAFTQSCTQRMRVGVGDADFESASKTAGNIEIGSVIEPRSSGFEHVDLIKILIWPRGRAPKNRAAVSQVACDRAGVDVQRIQPMAHLRRIESRRNQKAER